MWEQRHRLCVMLMLFLYIPEFKNLAQQIDLVDLLYGNTKLSSIKL